MRTVGDMRLGAFEQLDERFVDERRWLERVPGPLPLHERSRDPAQLAIDERHQLVPGPLIPLP